MRLHRFTLAKLESLGYDLERVRAVALSVADGYAQFDVESPEWKQLRASVFPPAPTPKQQSCDMLHCRFRGGEVAREQCQTCGGKVTAIIHACTIHARCSMFKHPIAGVKSCQGCTDAAR